MKKITLGRTNEDVSIISLGAWSHGKQNTSGGHNVGWSNQSDLDIWGALFGESLGRILVSTKPKNSQLFEEYMKGHTCNLLGVVCPEDEIIFRNSEEVVLSASMSDLRNSWKGTLNGGIY